MRLTDRIIRNTNPTSKDQFISDGDGLYLRVQPSGTKTFLIRTKHNGKSNWKSIGVYPSLSLLGARKARENSTLSQDSVAEIYRQFDRDVLAHYKRPEISRERFDNDILPVLGKLAVRDVTRTDIFKVINPILARGSKVMANRTLADMKHLFQFAYERGYSEDNPTLPITRKSCGGKEVPKDRALAFDELQAFVHGLLGEFHGKRGMGAMTIVALYLCVLTGQRASEVLWIIENWQPGMKVIILPPEICKTRSHQVHLSVSSRAVLKLTQGLPAPSDHRVLSHALRRDEATFTPHDLRRTLATRLSDLGVAPHVIEKILNHRMTGVMAVYNHAEYLPERMAALELWGRKVAELRRKKTPA